MRKAFNVKENIFNIITINQDFLLPPVSFVLIEEARPTVLPSWAAYILIFRDLRTKTEKGESLMEINN